MKYNFSDAFREGYAAFLADSYAECPYTDGTYGALEWKAGFNAASYRFTA